MHLVCFSKVAWSSGESKGLPCSKLHHYGVIRPSPWASLFVDTQTVVFTTPWVILRPSCFSHSCGVFQWLYQKLEQIFQTLFPMLASSVSLSTLNKIKWVKSKIYEELMEKYLKEKTWNISVHKKLMDCVHDLSFEKLMPIIFLTLLSLLIGSLWLSSSLVFILAKQCKAMLILIWLVRNSGTSNRSVYLKTGVWVVRRFTFRKN